MVLFPGNSPSFQGKIGKISEKKHLPYEGISQHREKRRGEKKWFFLEELERKRGGEDFGIRERVPDTKSLLVFGCSLKDSQSKGKRAAFSGSKMTRGSFVRSGDEKFGKCIRADMAIADLRRKGKEGRRQGASHRVKDRVKQRTERPYRDRQRKARTVVTLMKRPRRSRAGPSDA